MEAVSAGLRGAPAGAQPSTRPWCSVWFRPLMVQSLQMSSTQELLSRLWWPW